MPSERLLHLIRLISGAMRVTALFGVSAIAQTAELRARKSQRAAIVLAVAALHVGLVLVLLKGLVPPVQRIAREIDISVGGPLSLASATPPPAPKLLEPEVDEVPPPQLDIIEELSAPSVLAPTPPGSPNVRMPAIALPGAHTFPPLPPGTPPRSKIHVRLLLSIATSGAVSAAQISKSSGNVTLDSLAIDWVKSHWRYRPALDSGKPVSTTTIAFVTFGSP